MQKKPATVVRQLAPLVRLAPRQQALLQIISQNRPLPATQFVRGLDGQMAQSTVWHNLRQMRDMRLLRFGDGQAVRLTNLGRQLAEAFIAFPSPRYGQTPSIGSWRGGLTHGFTA